MSALPFPPGHKIPHSMMPWFDPSVIGLPTIEVPDSYDPRYGEQTQPVPVSGDPGMSVPMAPTATEAKKKRGGLLGGIGRLLGNVFMPEPDSLYAAALRGGIWDAKANQRAYQEEMETSDLKQEELRAKIEKSQRGGDFTVAGNNIVVDGPNGPEFRAPPPQPGEKERLIEQWRNLPEGDPFKDLIERVILQGNSDEVLRSREEIAGTRAGATTESARIRAAASGAKGGGAGKSGAGYEYKIINGKLMKRRVR